MGESANTRQRIFNVIGYIGFIAAIPLVLRALGKGDLYDFLGKNWGLFGSAGFLLIYFYFFPLLDLMFGSDRQFSPMILGILSSFLFFAMELPLGFMNWFHGLFSTVPLANYAIVPVLLALLAMLLGILLSYSRRRISPIVSILIVFIVPVGLYIAGAVFHVESALHLPLVSFFS